jgi:prevent-host-death family protein
MTRHVGAYEAKTRLPELLRDVEGGERITITVRGRAVAELTPIDRARRGAADAVAAMKAFQPIKGVEATTVREWIEEGRR